MNGAGCRAGIEQRVRALNAFLHDIYHRQEIVRAGRIPERADRATTRPSCRR